jgi:hypothetical protein
LQADGKSEDGNHDDLNTALMRFPEFNLNDLPVVTVDRVMQLVGMLRRKDVIACCTSDFSRTSVTFKRARHKTRIACFPWLPAFYQCQP